MKRFIIASIRWYQRYISPDTGILKRVGLVRKPVCVFHPTCSEYTIEAIHKYGVWRGVGMGVRRILRCHPWQKNHIDPVP